jgi:hypothetical protein
LRVPTSTIVLDIPSSSGVEISCQLIRPRGARKLIGRRRSSPARR